MENLTKDKTENTYIISDNEILNIFKGSKAFIYKSGLIKALPISIIERLIIISPKLIDWYDISYRSDLTNEFVIKYKNKLYMPDIVCYSLLSEDIINDVINNLKETNSYNIKSMWRGIWKNQNISLDFIKAHLPNLDMDLLAKNKNVPGTIKRQARKIYKQYKDLH